MLCCVTDLCCVVLQTCCVVLQTDLLEKYLMFLQKQMEQDSTWQGTRMHTHTHARTHARTHTHTHTYTQTYTYAHTHTYIHTHLHMHAHTHTYAHMQAIYVYSIALFNNHPLFPTIFPLMESMLYKRHLVNDHSANTTSDHGNLYFTPDGSTF